VITTNGRAAMLKANVIPTPLEVSFRESGPPPRPIHTRRAAAVVWLLLRICGHLLGIGLGGLGGTYTPRALARLLRVEFERLGGMWIKAAERLALERRAFPQAFCDELGQTRDRPVAIPPDVANAIIERDLGRAWQESFREFDVVPMAVTSTAQVHLARLSEKDTTIAIKVRRPGVEEALRRDLAWIRRSLILFCLLRILSRSQAAGIYAVLESTLEDDLDALREAEAMRATRRALQGWGYVPKVFARYCSMRVLVMEYIPGVLLSDYVRASEEDPKKARKWRKENGIRMKKLRRSLLGGEVRALLDARAGRGELVPGDIMMLRKNRIALLDFGRVSALEKGALAAWARPDLSGAAPGAERQ
jgi:ubiquinone biosynthesis protein